VSGTRATARRREAGGAARVETPRWRTLAAVTRAVVACELCPRLRAHCRQVAVEKRRAYRDERYWGRPVPAFGDPRARLVIVGLAPGAHGSNRTGRMFTGDSSGDWLYEVLYRTGFASLGTSVSRDDGQQLTDCWITAAGRCAPPDNKPTPEELARCRPYLAAELALLTRTRVVLALGRIGHEAWLRASGWWDRLAPRERPAFAHGAEHVTPDGIVLMSSFHPSRQNTQTGRLTRAMWLRVFERARERVNERS
jgi:uracil-DNA glycosylase family 4